MKLIGVGRIGRDVEVRYTPDGTAIANLSVAWNYGKPKDGKQPTQWVEAALFGERAEKLAPYLKTGTSIFLDLRDTHVETYKKSNGELGVKLTGNVDSIAFAGNRPPEKNEKPRSNQQDDDIPF